MNTNNLNNHDAQRLTIERGIPVPEPDLKTDLRVKYPFALMEVGDSFFVPGGGPSVASLRGTVMKANSKFPERQFTGRQVDGGYRIWRIK